MKRVIMLLTAAAVMAAMLVVMAAPAMAIGRGSQGVVRIDPFNNNLTVLPPNPIKSPINVFYPVDSIGPVLAHNPNVISEQPPCDGC
jgi:hypothetical protein